MIRIINNTVHFFKENEYEVSKSSHALSGKFGIYRVKRERPGTNQERDHGVQKQEQHYILQELDHAVSSQTKIAFLDPEGGSLNATLVVLVVVVVISSL